MSGRQDPVTRGSSQDQAVDHDHHGDADPGHVSHVSHVLSSLQGRGPSPEVVTAVFSI